MKTSFVDTKIWEVLKAAIVAVIALLLAILLSAFLIKITGLPDSSIAVFDIFIKIISLIIGCFFGFKSGDRGWLKGIIAGAIFAVLSFVTLGILSGNYEVNARLFYNILLSLVAGMVSGMFVSVVRK